MRHSQNFDKIDSFRKLVLNIFVLYNMVLGWGGVLFKKGLVFLVKSVDFGEVLIVTRSSIHQSKG